MILRHVQQLHGHFTADQLLAEVEPDLPGVSLPTVYATLDLLEELELVRGWSGWAAPKSTTRAPSRTTTWCAGAAAPWPT